MYGGDEVCAVVVDVGADTTKAGYAGEDSPKTVFSSAVGVLAGEDGGKQYTVDELHAPKPGLDVVSPYTDGVITSWDGYEQVRTHEAGHARALTAAAAQIWAHALTRRLRITSMEHPLMIAEPLTTTRQAREKLVELIFEKHAPPALFLAKNSVLSSFAVGRPTSLVIDCSASGTTVSAVHDGYALTKAMHRSPLGGAALTDLMLRTLGTSGVDVRPRYSFKRVATASGDFNVTPVNTPGVTASFALHKRGEIAADIKESCCRLLDTTFHEQEATAAPSAPYELPDGKPIEVGVERYKLPELLFNPSLLGSFPSGMDVSPGTAGSLVAELGAASAAGTLKGIPAAVLDVVNRCDVDIRREMFGGVVLTGAGSLFPNLKERLERELGEAAPATVKLKVLASASTPERKYSVWLGGSILASLGSFQQLWMSKAEYEEHGAAYIHKKCP